MARRILVRQGRLEGCGDTLPYNHHDVPRQPSLETTTGSWKWPEWDDTDAGPAYERPEGTDLPRQRGPYAQPKYMVRRHPRVALYMQLAEMLTEKPPRVMGGFLELPTPPPRPLVQQTPESGK